jgi:hypothetical protein
MSGRRGRGGWIFLALVALAHGATALADPGLARLALAGFARMLGEVAPLLGLVFALMYGAERFLTPGRTRAWLGRGSGWRGWALALLAGMVSTGPVYAWHALLAELRAKGMRTALVAAVLYARAIKLPLLPLLAHYFGLRYMLVLSLWLAAFAILSGALVERLVPTPQTE